MQGSPAVRAPTGRPFAGLPAAARWMVLGLALVSGACASTGSVPRPFPAPRPAERGASPGLPSVVSTALQLRGIPYRNGGSDRSGFDCSGFTQYVFAQHGVGLPREVRDQFSIGAPVEASKVSAGDLLFFRTSGRTVSHVGIALGDGRFVHAPSSRGVVRVESAEAPYWTRRFAGARRIGR